MTEETSFPSLPVKIKHGAVLHLLPFPELLKEVWVAESSRGFRQEIAFLEAHIHCVLEVNLDRLYFPFSLKVEKGSEWEGGCFYPKLSWVC